MFKQFNNYTAPVDTITDAGGSSGPKEMSKEDIFDFLKPDETEVKPEALNLNDDTKRKKEEVKEDTKETETETEEDETKEEVKIEEVDELAELEEELKEPDPEKLELVAPVRRAEILKAYPDLFKKFPYLESAYYRDAAFTAILPTIEDAKDAVSARNTLNAFEEDLGNGDIAKLLGAVNKENPEAFAKIADDYMGTLAQVDPRAYHHVLGNVLKDTIMAMVQEAKESQDEDLQVAAQTLHKFAFASSKWTPKTKLAVEKSANTKVEDKISDREKEFNKRQFTTASNELKTTVNNRLKATIETNLDPKKSMSDYVRKNAVKDSLDKVEQLMNQDSRFKSIVDKLWQSAQKSEYSKESMDRIQSAYFTKAKGLLLPVIKSVRNEALKGMTRKANDNKDDDTVEINENMDDKKSQSGRSSTTQKTSGRIKSASDIPRGMTTKEFLEMD